MAKTDIVAFQQWKPNACREFRIRLIRDPDGAAAVGPPQLYRAVRTLARRRAGDGAERAPAARTTTAEDRRIQ